MPPGTQNNSHAPGSPTTPLSDRFCAITTCHAPVPPLPQYRWKSYEPCRTRARRAARRRKDTFFFGFSPELPPTPPPDDAIQHCPAFQCLDTLLVAFRAVYGGTGVVPPCSAPGCGREGVSAAAPPALLHSMASLR
ncbi:hypothetical protein BV22DRAFT_737467 [Leucogyrophana mollusca]|uniref:Uncharacterized protein n=1 Tax=Leucogyrophana mollusca TaxID=85980 RepID=A0ACB8B978_9AGAM|nr:hypothetical protein BV22DRAFT_737467 [Leucogyrophana mollusca]